jgi:beta-phosphoglucomutase-like phosphatase (HAD superfamily)
MVSALGAAPQNCRAYEDTDLGLDAIRAAGMEAGNYASTASFIGRVPGAGNAFPSCRNCTTSS